MPNKKIMALSSVFMLLCVLVLTFGCKASPPTSTPPVQKPSTPASTSSPTVKPTQTPASSPTPAAAPITLRVSHYNAPTHRDSELVQWFGKRVVELTGGKVKFDFYLGGSLAKSGEELAAVSKGVSDMGIVNFNFHPADFPVNSFSPAVPFAPTNMQATLNILGKVYSEFPAFLQELEKLNLRYLYPDPADTYDLNTKKPVKTIADMKGLKIAVAGTSAPKYIAALGATAVAMPATERFTALQTGVIDGQLLNFDSIYTLKFVDHAPNVTFTGLGPFIYGVDVVNMDVWKKLPADVQKAMDQASKDAQGYFIETHKALKDKAQAEFKAGGIGMFTWSDEDRKKWAELMPDTPKQWADAMEAKGVPGKQIWERFKALAKEAGYPYPK